MLDILKELIERPENAKKYIISTLQAILLAIVTSKIYIYLFGIYTPILIGDINFWRDIFEFVINGRILMVAFIFLLIKYFVFELFSTIVYFILFLNTKKIKKNYNNFKDNSFFRDMLKFFDVIKMDQTTKQILPDRNFNEVFNLMKNLNKDEINSEIIHFRNSFLYEIFNLYSAFTLIYFFAIDNHYSMVFNVIVVIGFLFILYLIGSFQYLFELIDINYDEIFFEMKILKQIQLTDEFLNLNGINSNNINKPYSSFKTLKINDKEFGLKHFVGKPLNAESMTESHLSKNSKIFIITSKKFPLIIAEQLKNQALTIIEYNCDDEEFLKNLQLNIIK